jgi:hypothetical protein
LGIGIEQQAELHEQRRLFFHMGEFLRSHLAGDLVFPNRKEDLVAANRPPLGKGTLWTRPGFECAVFLLHKKEAYDQV